MLDPSLRYPRLTPNLREMIHGFSQGIQEASTPMHDFLASPDPNAMYNAMQIGSPILRDFYPHTQSPMPQTAYDQSDPAGERMTGACAEMNALFSNCYPQNPPEPGYRSDGNQDGGVMSLMSSPELQNGTTDATGSGGSGVSSTGGKSQRQEQSIEKTSGSQTSSQTPPPIDTSSCTPTSLHQNHLTKATQETVKREALSEGGDRPKRNVSGEEKQRMPSTRITGKSSSVSASVSVSASAPTSAPGVPVSAPHPQVQMNASAMMAANAAAMNPGMAGLVPFACAMPPTMGHMIPPPGTVHYQGRPMAFVTGANGPELIPMDMLAQATALQYGAAQAAVSRMMQPVAAQNSLPPRTSPAFEAIGGSRKRRRRQLLERSGCSEEQARQNRAHALSRLRQKKTLRSQQGKVRYACRKRIAMVRPRVNGRFATKEEVEECKRSNP